MGLINKLTRFNKTDMLCKDTGIIRKTVYIPAYTKKERKTKFAFWKVFLYFNFWILNCYHFLKCDDMSLVGHLLANRARAQDFGNQQRAFGVIWLEAWVVLSKQETYSSSIIKIDKQDITVKEIKIPVDWNLDWLLIDDCIYCSSMVLSILQKLMIYECKEDRLKFYYA